MDPLRYFLCEICLDTNQLSREYSASPSGICSVVLLGEIPLAVAYARLQTAKQQNKITQKNRDYEATKQSSGNGKRCGNRWTQAVNMPALDG